MFGHAKTDAAELAELKKTLKQWRAVVRLVAQRSDTPPRIDPEEYRRLHEKLLQNIRQVRGNGKRRLLLRNLEELTDPWSSSETLRMTQRDILNNLLERCQQIHRELFNLDQGLLQQWRRPIAAGVLVFLALLAGGVLLAVRGRYGIVQGLQDAAKQTWFVISRLGIVEWLLIASFIVTCVTIYLVWRIYPKRPKHV